MRIVQTLRILKVIAALSICTGFSYLAFHRGIQFREYRIGDAPSENQAVNDAASIVRGEHRYGIVSYTHYPNGPSYMLLLPMKLGVFDRTALRVVPIFFSSTCVFILVFGLLIHHTTTIIRILTLCAAASFFWQPSVLEWMGSLHEHGYVLALCFAAAGLGLIPQVSRFVFCVLAFISGWMGYDLTFAFIMSVLGCRWLMYRRLGWDARSALRAMILDGIYTGTGTALAIGGHFLQNAYFFGSYKAAFNDLFGSAAARAGLDIAKDINIGYYNFIQASATSPIPSRWHLLIGLAQEFASPVFLNTKIMIRCLGAPASVFAISSLFGMALGRISTNQIQRWSWTLGFMIIISALAGTSWTILMPRHAFFHFFFLPRHFFVSAILLLLALSSLADTALVALRKNGKC